MEVCAHCGHRVVTGRFCTQCGRPVDADDDWRTGTAERPAVRVPPSESSPAAASPATAPPDPPTLPPPAAGPPPPPRYPLFADDVAAAPTRSMPITPPAPPPDVPPAGGSRPASRRSRRSRLPWLVGAVALVVVVVAAVLVLADGDDDGDPAGDQTSAESRRDRSGGRSAEPTQEPAPVEGPLPTDGPVDLARYAAVTVPATAPPNEDVDGNMVRYESGNMLDGVAETCWRMPGSGADREITFSFPEPATLTEVGLINGYAKRSGDLDWYRGNRKLLQVTWVFDDDTTVEQSLDQTRRLQLLEIDPVTTTTVTLRLDEVSEPGPGRSARDNTAISDVSLVGSAA